jgi:predicted MPP superfamily phosphohydrolase
VFGALQVYTSSGAGTWGPPMRVGAHPEMVLLTFE